MRCTSASFRDSAVSCPTRTRLFSAGKDTRLSNERENPLRQNAIDERIRLSTTASKLRLREARRIDLASDLPFYRHEHLHHPGQSQIVADNHHVDVAGGIFSLFGDGAVN